MGTHRLWLEDDFEESFALFAIHSASEAYKMAFLINTHLGLRLRRLSEDKKVTKDQATQIYPAYTFEHPSQDLTFVLLANTCKMSVTDIKKNQGELFAQGTTPKTKTAFLLPEFKKVDYFLKMDSERDPRQNKQITIRLNEIKEIISSYEVPLDQVKTINHLTINDVFSKKDKNSRHFRTSH